MKKNLITLAKLPDSIISNLYLKMFSEKNSLMTFVFHGIFLNEKEKLLNYVDPQTWITIKEFEDFIKYYKKLDYKFITPDGILNGLDKEKKYILITFDDGYYNNKHVLKILKKYNVPCVFFISTNNIKENKSFWWDVLYRESKKIQLSDDKILQKQNQLKNMKNYEIEKYLIKKFGKKIFQPKSDIDRPFNISELKDFCKEKYVFIGNHTNNHAILTNYSSNEIKSQILEAQKSLFELTGITPKSISYPNGNYSDEIIKISKQVGIKIGLTVDYRKNYLPINRTESDLMRLGRFDLSGSKNIIKQCEMFRSNILLYPLISSYINNKRKK